MSATPNINGEKIQGSITGITLFSATTISGGTFYGDGSNLSGITDVFVSGGTYDNNTGTATFTNTLGGTFSVSGFTTGGTSGTDVYVTGGTFDKNTETITFTNSTGGTFSVTGLTDFFVSGGTYSAGTITFDNTNGSSFNVTGITSSGGDNFKYVKGNSISFLESNTSIPIRTFLLNEIIYYPIYVRQSLNITHAQLQVTSTAGAASTTIVGLYDNGVSGTPTNLLGSVIINTTSNSLFSTAFGSPISLTPGTYWVATNTNISYSCYCLRSAAIGSMQNTFVNVVSSDTGAGLNIYERYRQSYTYDGSLPNPVTSSLTITVSDYANPFITFLINY
jgi:hypothetical protein